jgi:hypothetical protein
MRLCKIHARVMAQSGLSKLSSFPQKIAIFCPKIFSYGIKLFTESPTENLVSLLPVKS